MGLGSFLGFFTAFGFFAVFAVVVLRTVLFRFLGGWSESTIAVDDTARVAVREGTDAPRRAEGARRIATKGVGALRRALERPPRRMRAADKNMARESEGERRG